jgi:hypothetical protein
MGAEAALQAERIDLSEIVFGIYHEVGLIEEIER